MKQLLAFASFFMVIIPLVRYLVPDDKLGVFSTAALLFVIVIHWFKIGFESWARAIPVSQVTDAMPLVRAFLVTCRKAVLQVINAHNGSAPIAADEVRVNVMLIVKRRWFWERRHMRIFFDTGAYTDTERSTKWYKGGKGSGTCGESWDKAYPVIYDSVDRTYKEPEKRLDPKQKGDRDIAACQSVLSIQIKARGEPRIIGALNFDSKLNVTKTHFHELDVIDRGLTEVRKIVHCLPAQSVRL